MGKDLDQTRYCTNCGSTNVRAQMWVNPNTHEVIIIVRDLMKNMTIIVIVVKNL